ncbi:hypothetical protein EDEG_01637 [Edhazardia aedis USNM 41457]|uniref:Uncharacterized protein n=1 Tax=Edhazardia aedis (strain USNM 41457) TaxID=1003232 RepID=J9D8J4_EDHAE|nr:hypothetical protein EDEG_01637 [Edhazardia aedis USNM 41457]|eukprot:EJW04061.1 hypothetical protein EDEG_01637 [Edhazardia aedis USNM 41457]
MTQYFKLNLYIENFLKLFKISFRVTQMKEKSKPVLLYVICSAAAIIGIFLIFFVLSQDKGSVGSFYEKFKMFFKKSKSQKTSEVPESSKPVEKGSNLGVNPNPVQCAETVKKDILDESGENSHLTDEAEAQNEEEINEKIKIDEKLQEEKKGDMADIDNQETKKRRKNQKRSCYCRK